MNHYEPPSIVARNIWLEMMNLPSKLNIIDYHDDLVLWSAFYDLDSIYLFIEKHYPHLREPINEQI